MINSREDETVKEAHAATLLPPHVPFGFKKYILAPKARQM
jgi:hypothetical protein